MLLLVFASDWVLMAEDEVHLQMDRSITSVCGQGELGTRTLVPGQVRSGPNMTTHGVLSLNSLPLVWKPSSSSLRYPPPQLPPFWYLTSYWITRGLAEKSTGCVKGAEMPWWAALVFATRPFSPVKAEFDEGSSTSHLPTYANVSPPTGVFFVASEAVQRSDQSSVNCSKNGA